MLGWLTLLLALLTATLFARAALASFSWSRLERLLADRKELLGRIFKNHEDVAAAVRVWFWLLVAVLVVLLAVANSGEGPRWLVLDERFLLLWIGFLLFELCITRPLARAFGERLLIACWPALDLLRLSLNPIIALEKYAESVLQKMTGTGGEEKSTAIQEEIKSVVNEGRREGSIRLENAEDMIEGLIELHTVKVADVMTPRTQMVMLKATDSVEHARQIVGDQGHSRIPVHGDNRDEIIGILYAKDLLPHLGPVTDGPAPLSSLKLRQPMFVPESKPVDALLKEFQRGRVHIAIVLDEYGGVAGLATIEDVLEEIVGEIADEYDEEEVALLKSVREGVWEAYGKIRIADLNAKLPLGIPEDADYDTLSGFLFNTLGRVPRAGETLRYQEATFTVTEANRRTVERIRIEVADPVPADVGT